MTMENEQDSKPPAIPPLPPATGSALVMCPWCRNYPTMKCLRRDKKRWHIRCPVCGARGPHTNLPESAVEEWNYRKPNAELSEPPTKTP